MRNCQILPVVHLEVAVLVALVVEVEAQVDHLPEKHRLLRLIAFLKNTRVISKTLKGLVNT